MAILGHEIGKALIDALGLPKQTRSFVLRADVGHVVTVECEYYPDDAPALVTAMAEYTLTRKPEQAPPVTAFNFDDWMRKRTDLAHDAMMLRHQVIGRIDAPRCGPMAMDSNIFSARELTKCYAPPSLLSVTPGNKVMLRSGGPEMTVCDIDAYGRAVCQWMSDGELCSLQFELECLTCYGAK